MKKFIKLVALFVGILAVSGSWSFALALMGVRFETKFFPMLGATPVAVFFVTLGSLGLLLMFGAFGLRVDLALASLLVGFLLIFVAWMGLDALLVQTYPRRNWN